MTRREVLQIAKPILFNTDMIRAIRDGRKTVTRRAVKFTEGRNPNWTGYKKDGLILYNGKNEPCNKKPPYQPGDYLYVRETWGTYNRNWWEADYFMYRADYPEKASTYTYSDGIVCDLPKWRPSIHMPKEAARIFLRVTDVRVERLQDIMKDPPGPDSQVVKEGCNYGCDFIAVWENTIKKSERDKYGWNANPWVWVIEFERVEVEP
ncbi:MAG: hypothetical protein Q4C52_13510 [Eubacteriales bacterium]|nr:hypothetical protein [Eubacteriales bacterium]